MVPCFSGDRITEEQCSKKKSGHEDTSSKSKHLDEVLSHTGQDFTSIAHEELLIGEGHYLIPVQLLDRFQNSQHHG